jgi:alpha-ribazole phosphatase
MSIRYVVFIRPGETDWNREGRWQGHVQVPLNASGRLQAHRLASFVRNTGMSALYTSDLRRALDTAAIIAEPLGIQPKVDERLRERGVGIWQGLTQQEVVEWYPEEYAKLQANPDTYTMVNGESRAEVTKRVQTAFDDILKQEHGETVGILSHTTAIRGLLMALVPDYDPKSHGYSNMSVTTIQYVAPNQWKTVLVDDVRHLADLESLQFPELEDAKKK